MLLFFQRIVVTETTNRKKDLLFCVLRCFTQFTNILYRAYPFRENLNKCWLSILLVRYFVIGADDVVRRRGYCDHFVTMCVCGWVGV